MLFNARSKYIGYEYEVYLTVPLLCALIISESGNYALGTFLVEMKHVSK